MKVSRLTLSATVATLLLTLAIIAAVFASGLFTPEPSKSLPALELRAYMQVPGIKGDVVSRSSSGDITPTVDDWIGVYGVRHSMYVPTDYLGGAAGGLRRRPYVVTKIVDTATVGLYKALSDGRHFQTVVIRFYRSDGAGGLENYFTTTLRDAFISSISHYLPDDRTWLPIDTHDFAMPQYGDMESISFNYGRITFEWKNPPRRTQ